MFIAPHSVLGCAKKGQCCRELSDYWNGLMLETITGDWMVMHEHDGVCDYLDRATGWCAVYDNRPLACARWNCEDCKLIAD